MAKYSIAQEIFLLRTDTCVLDKYLVTINSKKVSVVGILGVASRVHDPEIKKEAKYLDRQIMGF